MVKIIHALSKSFKSNFLTDLQFRRVFNKKFLDTISKAIVKGEASHSGQIVFAIENAPPLKYIFKNQSSRRRAVDLFEKLGVNKTINRTGLLIYVEFSGKKIEIMADSGLTAKIPAQFWADICGKLSENFKNRAFEEGVLEAICEVNIVLGQLFPRVSNSMNELSNEPIII